MRPVLRMSETKQVSFAPLTNELPALMAKHTLHIQYAYGNVGNTILLAVKRIGSRSELTYIFIKVRKKRNYMCDDET